VMMNSGLKQGGTIRVILPSRFAFGKSGSGSIPGNSSLDYTISVINPDVLDVYEDALINTYMQANNLTGFTKTATGLYHKIADVGTGVVAISDQSTITVEYTGKLFNGTVFDKTATGSTATFPLSNLVQGWREGLPLIKKGGSIRLLIPSHLGYGLSGSNGIPPFACLDFEIKVTDVSN
jgi:FKBP-type peptidyl-prolyl cis-trans isomerase FkpA